MYEYGTLRPPTDKEREDKYLALEVIEHFVLDENSFAVIHQGKRVGEGMADTDPYEPTLAELWAYTVVHGIPADARVVYHYCGSHQIALSWE